MSDALVQGYPTFRLVEGEHFVYPDDALDPILELLLHERGLEGSELLFCGYAHSSLAKKRTTTYAISGNEWRNNYGDRTPAAYALDESTSDGSPVIDVYDPNRLEEISPQRYRTLGEKGLESARVAQVHISPKY